METILGGLEAGGTKMVCVVGTGPDDVRALTRIPTAEPNRTLEKVAQFFLSETKRHGDMAGLGIGCFGPVNIDPSSEKWGRMQITPKPGWSGVDVVALLQHRLDVPIAIDTDVNAAALGEWRWGIAQGLDTFLYLTIGTGIGGGGMVSGQLMHGLVHPEMGHMRIRRDLDDDFAGCCPFHGDCWEGLASGTAMEKRFGQPAQKMNLDHPGWQREANDLAQGVCNLICCLSPERVIMGGGVMKNNRLLPMIRQRVAQLLGNYVQHPALIGDLDDYIVSPALQDRAGVLGSLALASRAFENVVD